MKFNINHFVKVKLTDHGRKHLKKLHGELYKHRAFEKIPDYKPPKEDEQGWSSWQFWDLMNRFGDVLSNGAPLPFETEIEVVTDKVAFADWHIPNQNIEDVTIRLKAVANGWEATAFNTNGFRRKAVHPNQGEVIYQLLRLLNAVDSETMPQPDQYVVPQWVKDCIEQFEYNTSQNRVEFCHLSASASIVAYVAFSRFLTKTVGEYGHGIFDHQDSNEFSVKFGEWLKVDFTDLPLTAENFKENLIKRCQRVGQAIMDAEKPKPIDPDEGLISMAEVEKLLADVEFVDSEVLDKVGRLYGEEASKVLTGANARGINGVFEDLLGNWLFEVNNKRFVVEFAYSLSGLTPAEQRQEILGRIRLVRQARAQALQEVASK